MCCPVSAGTGAVSTNHISPLSVVQHDYACALTRRSCFSLAAKPVLHYTTPVPNAAVAVCMDSRCADGASLMHCNGVCGTGATPASRGCTRTCASTATRSCSCPRAPLRRRAPLSLRAATEACAWRLLLKAVGQHQTCVPETPAGCALRADRTGSPCPCGCPACLPACIRRTGNSQCVTGCCDLAGRRQPPCDRGLCCGGQASATRDYLHSLNQNGETLPDGPVIISPDGLFPSLYRELARGPAPPCCAAASQRHGSAVEMAWARRVPLGVCHPDG